MRRTSTRRKPHVLDVVRDGGHARDLLDDFERLVEDSSKGTIENRKTALRNATSAAIQLAERLSLFKHHKLGDE